MDKVELSKSKKRKNFVELQNNEVKEPKVTMATIKILLGCVGGLKTIIILVAF